MELVEVIFFLNGALCGGLAVAGLFSRSKSVAHWLFSGGMCLLAVEAMLRGISLYPLAPAARLANEERRLFASALVPAVWLAFSLTYSRGNARDFLRRWSWGLVLALAVPLGFLLVFGRGGLVVWGEKPEESGYAVMLLGAGAKWANLAGLLASLFILMNLEQTFRSSVGTIRWRLKYMVIGLMVLFGGRVYLGSHVLLYSAIDLSIETVGCVTLLVGCGLIAFSIARARFSNLDVYPSHAVLRHSITGVIAGGYLLVVGVLAKVVAALGGAGAFPLMTLTIVVGGLGVSLLVLSDRVRQRVKRFVSRNFQRPFHDYRRVWSLFTERTTVFTDDREFCREVSKLVAETFEVLSASLWLVSTETKGIDMIASTAISSDGIDPPSGGTVDGPTVLGLLRPLTYPISLQRMAEAERASLRQLVPEHFRKGGGQVCVPLVSGGELMGALMLGDRVGGMDFSVDDFDLLKCIGDHVAARLRNIQLSSRLLQAKELEAFQTLSAFFVHDLKNTASTLSLMLQNMARHFDDPAFREDAMRGLGRSVEHINQLISELSALRQKLEPRLRPTDLDQLIGDLVGRLDVGGAVRLRWDPGGCDLISLDPDMIQKVVTNLVVNAREAITGEGEVAIRTERQPGWEVIEVRDTGAGMTQEFIQKSLFKPFQTTKKKGLGIGLFHCRMIVEAHGGRIQVESAPGKGTLVRVLLPVQP